MKLRFLLVASTLALALPLAGFESAAQATTPPLAKSDVEEALTCQCGCGLTVAACNHLECSFAIPVRKDVDESLAKGETGEQILDRYKKEYGEKVLSSPIAEGFNILAWVAPYFAIFTSGLLMFVFLRRRAMQPPPATGREPAASAPTHSDERLARLRDEVEDMER